MLCKLHFVPVIVGPLRCTVYSGSCVVYVHSTLHNCHWVYLGVQCTLYTTHPLRGTLHIRQQHRPNGKQGSEVTQQLHTLVRVYHQILSKLAKLGDAIAIFAI